MPLARLDIVSFWTKFESSSFNHSWDMDGAPKFKKVWSDVTTPLSGTVCRPSAGTSYGQPVHQIWLTTKIWKATKNAKIEVVWEVRGHPRSSETSPFVRARMISYSTLMETTRLSCTVFELYRVFRRKCRILTHPTCICRPCRGWSRSNFAVNFGVRKLESRGYRAALFAWSYV